MTAPAHPSPPPSAQPSALPASAPAPLRLSEAALGQRVTVTAVQAPAGAPEWAGQLSDLGFVPGEAVQLMAQALGGDPLVVRVGHSTFALRRAEAACVWVVGQAAARA